MTPWPGHEAGDRTLGADRAGVGERDGHAGEVVGGELVVVGLADELVVAGDELGEASCGRRRGCRAPATCASRRCFSQVDGQAEVHVRVAAPRAGRRRGPRRRCCSCGHAVGDGAHDGVADEVGEADLAAPGAAEVAVDDRAVDLEQLGGTSRKLVAVGTSRLASMFLTIRAPAPRMISPSAAAGGAGGAAGVVGVDAVGVAAGVGRGAEPAPASWPTTAWRPWAGSRRRSPARSRSPSAGWRGTARTSRRPARRWGPDRPIATRLARRWGVRSRRNPTGRRSGPPKPAGLAP